MRLCATQPKPWIGWRRSRATDSRIFAEEEFIGVKSLALPSVLVNIRRPVMETVWDFDIWKENSEKNGRKAGEKNIYIYMGHFRFAILFCGGFELYKTFHWNVISFWHALPTLFRYVPPSFVQSFCPIFWTPFCLWYQCEISVVFFFDEMQDIIVRTSSYTTINSDELKEVLESMRNDIGARTLDMALYQSGLMAVEIK